MKTPSKLTSNKPEAKKKRKGKEVKAAVEVTATIANHQT
jgi:hypothetical protein